MPDTDLDLELEEVNKTEERIKNLSSKVKTTAEERDAAKAAAEAAEAAKTAAEKELSFYKAFSDVNAKYQGASEFSDAIREKFMSGYSMEDAAVAVLNKEGKLAPQAAPAPAPAPAAGGSASTALPSAPSKNIHEMDRSELKAAFQDAVRKGDIGLA